MPSPALLSPVPQPDTDMNTSPDLARLADPFPPDDVEWKPGATTRDKTKGLAMAYISSRAVQDRLDEVCGPDGWRNEFMPAPNSEGGVLCGISVRVVREDPDGIRRAEWITKWDGAENTDVEAVKGGLSSAMKRAAVQWGIGRYLYRVPQQWVRLDERGRFVETPRLPADALPAGARNGPALRPDREAPRSAPGQPEPAARSAPPVPRAGERRVIHPAHGQGSGHDPQR